MPIDFIEQSRPKLFPFNPTTPEIKFKERDLFTFFTFEVDERRFVTRLEGNTYKREEDGTFSFKETIVANRPTSTEYSPWIADFFLKGGTCFMPNSAAYLDIFLKEWDLGRLILTGDFEAERKGRKVRWGSYSFCKTKFSLVIRHGQVWGRVYSFEELFPKAQAKTIDTKTILPLPLKEFTDIGVSLLENARQYGVRVDSGQTAASVVQLFLLDELKSCFSGKDETYFLHIERAHQCYKASRFEARLHGTFQLLYYYDLKNAFPRVLMSCPAIQACLWIDDHHYHREAFYGFIRCRVVTSEDVLFSPIMSRFQSVWGDRLVGFVGHLELWITKDEYDFMLSDGLGKCVEIQEASWGVPLSNIRPFSSPMAVLISLSEDNLVLGNLAKGMAQRVCGKMAQVHENKNVLYDEAQGVYCETVDWGAPPVSGMVYAAKVSGAIRARITRLALEWNAVAIFADGFYTTSPIPDDRLPKDLILKAEGPGSVWTDMYHDHPGEEVKYLDTLLVSNENASTLEIPITVVQTIRGVSHEEGLRGKKSEKIGTSLSFKKVISLGTKKRKMDKHTRKEFLTGNPDSIVYKPEDLEEAQDKVDPNEY